MVSALGLGFRATVFLLDFSRLGIHVVLHILDMCCDACSTLNARRVAAHIVRLAVLEPGDNMIGGPRPLYLTSANQ
jgi:hypothetical protein